MKKTNKKMDLRINQALSKMIYALILIIIVVIAVVAGYAYMTSINQTKDIVETAKANSSFTTLRCQQVCWILFLPIQLL